MLRVVRKPFSIGLVLLCAVVGALVFASAPALAATPPESPITSAPAEVKGSTAVLQGLVNPLKLGVVGWFFEYKAGGVCTGGVTTPLEGPEETEMRPVAVGIAGLTQETTYTVCLVAENEAKERTAGAPVTFTTITPEPPAGLEAEPVAARTATLHGVLNPKHAGEAGSYEFVYRQSETECMGGEPGPQEEKSTPEEAATGAEGQVAMPAQVTGLEPNLPYTFCLRAKNEAGEEALSAPVTFTTLAAAPTVAGESVSSVEASAATLEAEIVPEGAATTYHFVYVEAAKYRPDCAECEDEPTNAYALGAGTPESESIGADDAAHAAEARITGLAPGTTYHYSVVATNAESPAGGTPGPDKTFTTNPAPSTATTGSCPNEQLRAEQPFGLTLPDCRAYEMVSPVVTGGQDATDSFISSAPRASVQGEAVAYASKGLFNSTSGEPAGGTVENEYLSSRSPGGWTTRLIGPQQDPIKTESRPSYDATVFTPELTAGVMSSNAPIGIEGPAGVFRLYHANLETGATEYIGEEEDPAGASEDLSHVVFGAAGEIFEWINGKVVTVNVDNTGTLLSGTVGAVPVFLLEEDLWHAVSSNGSRVFFSTPTEESNPETGALYVRVNAEHKQSEMNGEECLQAAEACTIEVSASTRETPDPNGPRRPRYWGASADGSKVFFTSNAELTKDAYTGPEDNAPNLYEYELSREPGKLSGRLTDLTVDESGEGAAVKGVVQISEGGAYVYFVAEGQLAEGATAGQPNLYVVHDHGAPRFIAALGAGDESVWKGQFYPDESSPQVNAAVVSPRGNRLAFVSEQELTGYDNEQARKGECERETNRSTHVSEDGACDEVYLYEAEAGGLVCASCNPRGERPTGGAAFGPVALAHSFAEYRSRNLLEDGTVFFDSSDALVPNASDGRENVYEYENAQVHAISNVAGGYESFFLDASGSEADGEEGGNVFFASADRLLPQDKSDNVVVWDARVDGGFPVTAAAPSCDNADSCKPPESSQPAVFGAPSSSTFSGPGNTTPTVTAVVKPKSTKKRVKCKKGFVKNKKNKCVKKKKKQAKKATNKRGARS